jgi:RNA polymerase sigma factor (sigma-70 family)
MDKIGNIAEFRMAVANLKTTSHSEQQSAEEKLFGWILTETCQQLHVQLSDAPAEVHDIAEDVLVKLIVNERAHQSVLNSLNPEAFVATMIKYTIIDMYRRMRRQQHKRFISFEDGEGAYVEDPIQFSKVVDLADMIPKLRQKLTEKEQELFDLFIWEHLSYIEIAERFNITLSAVYQRFARMLAHIRCLIEPVES